LAAALSPYHKFVKMQLVEAENVVGTIEADLLQMGGALNVKEGRP